MKKKILQKITGVLIVTLITGSMILTGCGQTETVSDQTEAVTETESGTNGDMAKMNENSVYGQITAIEGETITIALAETPQMPSGGGEGKEAPSGEAPSGEMSDHAEGESGDTQETTGGVEQESQVAQEESADGEASSETGDEMAQGETPSGEMPSGEAPDGEMPTGGGQMELTLTGEEQTITVTDATTYLINGETGSLEDLQVDDTVTIVLAEDGSAESISTGMGGGGNGGPGGSGARADEGSSETGTVDSTESETGTVDSTESETGTV